MVLGGLVPFPIPPTITIRPRPPATRQPCSLPARHSLGWARTPFLVPYAPSRFAGNTSCNSPLQTITKLHRPLLRQKNSRRVYFGPWHRLRCSGQLRERDAAEANTSYRSTLMPSFVLPSARHWRIPLRNFSFFVGPLCS